MNRDVLIGALGDQLRKYTDSYKVFKSVEMNAHLISFGPTFTGSDPNKRFMDIMGDTSDPFHWGRNLFYPFHYKWEDAKIVLLEKSEINRLRAHMSIADNFTTNHLIITSKKQRK